MRKICVKTSISINLQCCFKFYKRFPKKTLNFEQQKEDAIRWSQKQKIGYTSFPCGYKKPLTKNDDVEMCDGSQTFFMHLFLFSSNKGAKC